MRKIIHSSILHVSIFVFLTISLTQTGSSQEPKSYLLEGKPKYVLISNISFSEPVYFEEENDARAGYMYRIVTTSSEIYNSIFLERIIIDIEESPVEIVCSKKIELRSLFDFYDFSKETDLVVFKEWLSSTSFIIKIGEDPFRFDIIESNMGLEIKVTRALLE